MDTHPPIRLVVFDNNGTALDDLHVAYGSVCAIFDEHHVVRPTLFEYRNEITADFMQFYWSHGIDRSVTGDQLNVIRRRYYLENMRSARYRRDFVRVLRSLRGEEIKLGVCSAEQHNTLADFLIGANLHRFFPPSMIEGSAWPKKAPYLLRLAETASVMPSQCAYVGDTVDDIEAAKEAGFMAIAFTHESAYNTARRLARAEPDFMVGDFCGLEALMLNSLI